MFNVLPFLATIERASLAFSQEDKSVSLKWLDIAESLPIGVLSGLSLSNPWVLL